MPRRAGEHRAMRWSACAILSAWLVVIGCDEASPREGDAGRDAAQGSVDAARPGDDASAVIDAASDAPPSGVSGRVTYDRRPFARTGLGAAIASSAPGVIVVLLDGEREVARTTTDEDGAYAFDAQGDGVRVLASSGDPESAVTDFDGATYAFRGPAGDLHVGETDFAGALAIAHTMREGLEYARVAFERDEPFPPLETHWERGRTTPGGTSYASGDELWILGGPDDTDEFDEPVLLHELGHFLQHVIPFSRIVGGDPHAGADTDPRLAWNEGWPSFFASAVRGDPFYGDTVGGEISLALDLGALPRSGDFVANAGAPMSQPLSEWIIASSLWRLYVASADVDQQRARSFGVLTRWLAEGASDRAADGPELVDFLDGYLCTHAGADRAVIESYVVADRSFPYDLAPPCEKPGRPRAVVMRDPAPVWLPGHRIVDVRGRVLREIVIR
ncbi:Glucosamine-fructose-6-phosphate aminotransferase [Sandaracinus amylolyticus]|uniref:Glucosamine-fructose-6-phosphate aminotransferase n=2 Tax=Sandaracinus amylolyticus TaxID=927083 RepID=A0A0F6SDH0_9BACT|nr:Glucosamine-fructose-6-phosphate aminotransferase [Sandaracinus amylolyticus]